MQLTVAIRITYISYDCTERQGERGGRQHLFIVKGLKFVHVEFMIAASEETK